MIEAVADFLARFGDEPDQFVARFRAATKKEYRQAKIPVLGNQIMTASQLPARAPAKFPLKLKTELRSMLLQKLIDIIPVSHRAGDQQDLCGPTKRNRLEEKAKISYHHFQKHFGRKCSHWSCGARR